MPFLAPLGLLLGGLTVPLVAMYFLKLRRHRVKVPSVLLWQQFQKAERLASPFERFRRSLLLLFQLLALLLLVLAASRPFLAADAPTTASIVLVLDVSASMGATDADPYDHRLAQAVARASERVSAMSATDEAMIVVAGPRTEVLVPFTSDRGALTAALDGLEPTEAEGSLRDGLVLAVSMARTRQNVDVAVFSDGGGPPVTDVPTGGATVSLVSVGRSDENTAITAVDLRRSPSSDLLRELFVTVEHLGPGRRAGDRRGLPRRHARRRAQRGPAAGRSGLRRVRDPGRSNGDPENRAVHAGRCAGGRRHRVAHPVAGRPASGPARRRRRAHRAGPDGGPPGGADPRACWWCHPPISSTLPTSSSWRRATCRPASKGARTRCSGRCPAGS
jgi:hypothetical protein